MDKMPQNPILIDTLVSVLTNIVSWLAAGLLSLLVWIVRRIFLYSKRIELLEDAKEDEQKQREEFRTEMRESLRDHNDGVMEEIKSTRDHLTKRIDQIFSDRANH